MFIIWEVKVSEEGYVTGTIAHCSTLFFFKRHCGSFRTITFSSRSPYVRQSAYVERERERERERGRERRERREGKGGRDGQGNRERERERERRRD